MIVTQCISLYLLWCFVCIYICVCVPEEEVALVVQEAVCAELCGSVEMRVAEAVARLEVRHECARDGSERVAGVCQLDHVFVL